MALTFKTLTITGLCTLCTAPVVWGQELNCTVSINAQQIEAAYQERFTTLQSDLTEFINQQAWTNKQFAEVEKIQCTMAFVINSIPETDKYSATLTVQSRRPVYNSNYSSTLLNFKDAEVEFNYTEGQTLTFTEYDLSDNLIAVTAYYVYLILGLDFDSFSPQGGEAFLRKAENIVSQMQTADTKGWKAFDSRKNRHAIITDLLAESNADYRQLWYTYHRQGLDAMAQSVDKGRSQVSAACTLLKNVKSASPQSVLLTMFIDAKMDELLNIYSKAPQTDKNQAFETLQGIYPSYTNKLNEIKKAAAK
jgi:hypothetical protein